MTNKIFFLMGLAGLVINVYFFSLHPNQASMIGGLMSFVGLCSAYGLALKGKP